MPDKQRLREERIAISDVQKTINDLHQCQKELHDAITLVNLLLKPAQILCILSRERDQKVILQAALERSLLKLEISKGSFAQAAGHVNNAVRLMNDLKGRLKEVERYAADIAKKAGKDIKEVKVKSRGGIGLRGIIPTTWTDSRLILDEKSELANALNVSAATELNIQRCKAIKEKLEELAREFPKNRAIEEYAHLQVAAAIARGLEPVQHFLLAAFNAATIASAAATHMFTLQVNAMAQEQATR